MICPDCGKTLIDVATSCRCGWMKSADPVAVNQDREARLALELRELTEQALAGLDEKGLARMPDEPVKEWHGRMRVWMRENAGFKRFGSAGS